MKFDLEDRLIKFSVAVLEFSERIPDTKDGTHLSGQLVRSSTAPTLIYGEARAAETHADFIHKMGMTLKELRETKNNLVVLKLRYFTNDLAIDNLLRENQELVSIFAASINTARKKLDPRR